MVEGIKKMKRGRPPGSKTKTKTALVRLDKKASAVAAQIAVLKAERKLYTLGKDRLAEIDNIMMRLALAYSPEEKDKEGNPCRPFWENDADEMRFLRFMGLAYDCAKARAPYESPRPIAGDQTAVDEDDGEEAPESERIIDPPTGDIVPPGEQGRLYVGPPPRTPDDIKMAHRMNGPVIDAEPVKSEAR